MKIIVKNVVYETFTHDKGDKMLSGVKKNGVLVHQWNLPTYAQNRKNLRAFMLRASEKTCRAMAANHSYLN